MKSPWPTKKLREICEENIKSPFKVEDATNSGEYPFFTSGESVLTHDEYLVDGENIFLATGGYANVKYYNGKASYSTDTWSLKVKNALTKFVFYQILARLKYIDEVLFRGSGLRHLQKKEFLNLEIPLPPLPIHQKIVKILDTIQEAIDIHDKIIEKMKELKKSLMAELFKYGAPSFRKGRKLKKTEIGEIPEDWEVVRLGDENLFELIMGQSPPSSSYNQNKKGLPFLQGKAEFGEIYPQPIKWCDKPIKIAEKNDILISVRAPVGDLNLADQKYCIGRGLAAIRLKNNVDPFFLFNCLNFFKNQILTYGTGSTFKAITKEILENFKIPLPTLPEQQEIAEILQTVDQKIEIDKKKKELYEELFKTILNKIMSQEIDIEKIEI
jgi:type I restriction enzyme S subunit